MINAEEALRIILESTSPLKSEKIKLADAPGRVLADDIVAKEDIPPFDNSSMDGFAVVAVDLINASESKHVSLKILGESSAGNPFRKKLKGGCAVRVMTGGVIPAGSDAVVPIEATNEEGGGRVLFASPARSAQHIRLVGEDIRRGETILERGTVIGPPQLGILASLGHAKARVYRKPLVRILATGDELVEVNKSPKEGQIRNSSTHTLAAYVTLQGGVADSLGIVSDKRKRLKRRIKEGLDADVLLITGGVSVGKYDYVKEVLEELGVEIKFWKVNIKPGKPLVFGQFKRTLVFGLPGNPVSTSVTFLQFVRPALHKMGGRAPSLPMCLTAVIDHDFSKSDGKRHYVRCIVESVDGQLRARSTGTQSSGVMSSMSKANALMIIPEDVAHLQQGDSVQVEMF